MPTAPTVEHVVLYRVKAGADSAAVDVWLSGLRSLASLDAVAHLAAAPVLRSRSPSPLYTHVLHCRYRSQVDLAAYADHPAHLAVVRELGAPLCDDLMAVDWVGDVEPGEIPLKPGAAIRVTLARLGEGVERGEAVETLRRIGESCPGVEQVSCGENFSPARAKGFAVGSIWVLPGSEELDLLDVAGSQMVVEKEERMKALVESVIVVDFVVQPNSEPSLSSSVEESRLP